MIISMSRRLLWFILLLPPIRCHVYEFVFSAVSALCPEHDNSTTKSYYPHTGSYSANNLCSVSSMASPLLTKRIKKCPTLCRIRFCLFFSSETKFNSDVLYAKRPKHERLKRTPLVVVFNGTGRNNVQIFEEDLFLLPATERQLF